MGSGPYTQAQSDAPLPRSRHAASVASGSSCDETPGGESRGNQLDTSLLQGFQRTCLQPGGNDSDTFQAHPPVSWPGQPSYASNNDPGIFNHMQPGNAPHNFSPDQFDQDLQDISTGRYRLPTTTDHELCGDTGLQVTSPRTDPSFDPCAGFLPQVYSSNSQGPQRGYQRYLPPTSSGSYSPGQSGGTYAPNAAQASSRTPVTSCVNDNRQGEDPDQLQSEPKKKKKKTVILSSRTGTDAQWKIYHKDYKTQLGYNAVLGILKPYTEVFPFKDSKQSTKPTAHDLRMLYLDLGDQISSKQDDDEGRSALDVESTWSLSRFGGVTGTHKMTWMTPDAMKVLQSSRKQKDASA